MVYSAAEIDVNCHLSIMVLVYTVVKGPPIEKFNPFFNCRVFFTPLPNKLFTLNIHVFTLQKSHTAFVFYFLCNSNNNFLWQKT